jgi:hypothetical protein
LYLLASDPAVAQGVTWGWDRRIRIPESLIWLFQHAVSGNAP